MKKENSHTASTLITVSGGVEPISKKCEISISAVAKWRVNGIPDRYWSSLIALSNFTLTLNDFFVVNEKIRNKEIA